MRWLEHGNGLKYNKKNCLVHIPAGYRGVLYPAQVLRHNRTIFELREELPAGIFNDDDAYFGIVLSVLKIPLYSIPNKAGAKLTEARSAGEGAVAENATKPRIDNEMEIF